MQRGDPAKEDELTTTQKLAMKACYHLCNLFCRLIAAVFIAFPVALSIYFAVYLGQYLTGSVHHQSFSSFDGATGEVSVTFPLIKEVLHELFSAWNATMNIPMYLPPPQ